jgi:hypothetical protein
MNSCLILIKFLLRFLSKFRRTISRDTPSSTQNYLQIKRELSLNLSSMVYGHTRGNGSKMTLILNYDLRWRRVAIITFRVFYSGRIITQHSLYREFDGI